MNHGRGSGCIGRLVHLHCEQEKLFGRRLERGDSTTCLRGPAPRSPDSCLLLAHHQPFDCCISNFAPNAIGRGIFRMSGLAAEPFEASCAAPMQLIALLALSAPPSDCFFAPGSRPCRDLCSTLQDCSLISSSPFLSLLSQPRHCWMACLGSFSAPRHTWRQPTKSSRKAWSSTQQALTSFVPQSSCSAFAGRIP